LHLLNMCVPGLNLSSALPHRVSTKILPLLTMSYFPPSLIVSGEIRGG
jgi:hypothetical protein